MNTDSDIFIHARTITAVLLCTAIVLAVAHVIAVVIWYRDLLPIDDWMYIAFFDLDEEESLGTWFSALILLAAGLLALLQGYHAKRRSEGWHAWWWFLAFGFHLLSLDEVAGFHEFVNTVVEDTHWTTFGAAIVLLVGIAYLPFLRALPPRTRWLFVISGAIYVGGAVGVEWATRWYEDNDLLDTLAYNLWNAVEEFMEMAGIILFIYAMLQHLGNRAEAAAVTFRFAR